MGCKGRKGDGRGARGGREMEGVQRGGREMEGVQGEEGRWKGCKGRKGDGRS